MSNLETTWRLVRDVGIVTGHAAIVLAYLAALIWMLEA